MGAVNAPSLLFGSVMHGRMRPVRNNFRYGIYYLAFPLSSLQKDELSIPYNRPGFLSFYGRDHGLCDDSGDGSDLERWARDILAAYDLRSADGEIILICMPRVFGYVFNPVSFWLCHDKQGALRAVLCEVHNTFGERHTYVCAHPDQRPITADDTLTGEKHFHVSPFYQREGSYRFRFDSRADSFKVHIDYYGADGEKDLITALGGTYAPMDKAGVRRAFWRYPLVTFKATALIHWQALKLVAKGIKYVRRPQQKPQRVSATDNITQM